MPRPGRSVRLSWMGNVLACFHVDRQRNHVIPVEKASTRLLPKPWGRDDLQPWSAANAGGGKVGEIWFQRAAQDAPEPGLLLKLLFTNEPLSIQVHPDDTVAHAAGLPNGKTEAWYVLAARSGAEVTMGLKRELTSRELRSSIDDGSIAKLVRRRSVRKDDVVFVPAGTIHAIGAGLVVAEIQQASDTTYRLFDYGRKRELHAAAAVAAADRGIAKDQDPARRLSDVRRLLIACPYFVLERIDLPPETRWDCDASTETWLLALEGGARVGKLKAGVGDAFYLESDRAAVIAGPAGFTFLAAYVGDTPRPDMLSATSQNHFVEA